MTSPEQDAGLLRGHAYHEAGHTVLQFLFGMDLAGVSILAEQPGTGGASSYRHPHPVLLSQRGVFFEGTVERDRFICHLIMQTQAGEVAQQLFCPETMETHQSSIDRAHTKQLIKTWDRYAAQYERDEKIDDLQDHTKTLLADARCAAAVHALAEALLVEKKLTGDKAHGLILDAVRRARQSIAGAAGRITCPHCEEYRERGLE